MSSLTTALTARQSECACHNSTYIENSIYDFVLKMENQNKSAEYWIKNLNLVEHPEHKDGFFAVPFEDTFKVHNKNKVISLNCF